MIPELDPMITGPVGAWIATYLVHGGLLFAVAWLVSLAVRSAGVREQLWRAALVGPLVTASVQVGAGVSPLGGTFRLPGAEAAVDAAEPEPARTIVAVVPASHASAAPAPGPPAPPEPESEPVRDAGLHRAATLLLALGIASLTLRALLEALRMRQLRDTAPLEDAAFTRDLEDLRRRAGIRRRVRLERSARGVSPYATGLLRPRIVVPDSIVGDLDHRARRAMLAHELGHIARLDPAWSAAARTIASLFCFQPLNWIVANRIDESAEFACDEFAVRLTRDEVGLARCLTTIAEQILGAGASRALPACPMAHKDSKLGERVKRILGASHEAPRRRVATRLGALALVASTAAAAPTIAGSATEPDAGSVDFVLEDVTAGTPSSLDLAGVFAGLALTAREMRVEARDDVGTVPGLEAMAESLARSLRARRASGAPLPRSR